MHITAKELIEALSKMPPKAPVEAVSTDGLHFEIGIVKHVPSEEEEIPGFLGEGVVKLL